MPFAATASYRLLPVVEIKPGVSITGALADKLATCFSPGVIRIVQDADGAATFPTTFVPAPPRSLTPVPPLPHPPPGSIPLSRPFLPRPVPQSPALAHSRAPSSTPPFTLATTGVRRAVVGDARNDSVSREVFRHPDLADKVILSRKRDHFICTRARCSLGATTEQAMMICALTHNAMPARALAVMVESTGILPAKILLRESIKHLMAKIEAVKAGLAALQNPDAADPME